MKIWLNLIWAIIVQDRGGLIYKACALSITYLKEAGAKVWFHNLLYPLFRLPDPELTNSLAFAEHQEGIDRHELGILSRMVSTHVVKNIMAPILRLSPDPHCSLAVHSHQCPRPMTLPTLLSSSPLPFTSPSQVSLRGPQIHTTFGKTMGLL